jgi:uridylate kinase
VTKGGHPFRRAILKLSGEGLAGRDGRLDPAIVDALAADLRELLAMDKQIAIVVGGGNWLRGNKFPGINRAVADQMGMLATAMNGLALQDALEQKGIDTRVQSAVAIADFCEPFIRRRCIRHLEKKRVVILVAGTGNPFFSTDSAAALRASELKCEMIFKATKVDGIYTSDPEKDPNATKIPHANYQRVLAERLQVMDATAIDLARGSSIPIYIFSLREPGNIRRALLGEDIGSMVSD